MSNYAHSKLTIRDHNQIRRMIDRRVQPSVIAVHFQVTRQWVGKIKRAHLATRASG